MASIIISVVALVVAAATLAYSVKVALVYHRFNEQVKDWTQSLDDSMMDSINRAARNILRSLDAAISENNNNEKISIEDENDFERTLSEDVAECDSLSQGS